MPALNSYEALVESIERALIAELEPQGSAAHLAPSIDRMILTESRAGELRLAYLRLVIIVPYVGVVAWALLRRDPPVSAFELTVVTLLSVAWLTGSVALVVALRRGWYRRWVPHAAPVVDAGMILAMAVVASEYLAVAAALPADIVAYVVALCVFLSLSGGMRVSLSAARTGIALAVTVFVLTAFIARMELVPAVAIALTLLATGLLSTSEAVLLRRVVTDEVARATLAKMYDKAEEKINARDHVLKMVSHDLRNPLNRIKMSASALLGPQAEHDAPVFVPIIERAVGLMNRLIGDLLDVAKLESGRLGISPQTIEVEPLLRQAQETLAPSAAEMKLTLDVKVGGQLPTITADGDRVIQVLLNLGGNAIKFTPSGGRIILRADPAPGGVRFAVSDTGPGIPREQLDKIFSRFWQGDPADRRGIGLGLTIAKGIVEAHGGRIQVDSPPGEGATFHFKLDTVLPPTASGDRERRKSGTSG